MAQTSNDRADFYDCLRALAIALVAVHHYYSPAMPGGAIGVSIFFCLSGYLITSILLKEQQQTPISALKFMVRRFIRVYPPYVFALLLNYWALSYSGSEKMTFFLESLPDMLTFRYVSANWIQMGIGVLWTLRIEFWFYMLMPVLMLAVGQRTIFKICVLALIIASLYCRYLYPGFSFSWADNLLVGSVVALVCQNTRNAPLSTTAFNWISRVGCGLLFALAIFVSKEDIWVWQAEAIAASCITGVMIWAYVRAKPTFSSPVIAWFGRISYSFYLTHAIPLDYMELFPWTSNITFIHGKIGAIMLLTFAIAVAMHYLIEKPAIMFGRWLTRKRSSIPSGATPA